MILRRSLLQPVSIRVGLFQIVDQPVQHVGQIYGDRDRAEAVDCRLYVELPFAHALCLECPGFHCCKRVVSCYASFFQRRAPIL